MSLKLNGYNLNTEKIRKVVYGNDKVLIDSKAKKHIDTCRKFVDKLANEERAIYGINSGFGPLCNERVKPEYLEKHQVNLLHHLSVGQGPHFSREEVRSIILCRVNALCRGYSGIGHDALKNLISYLNNDLYPIVPQEGSVGASGDLVPLAHIARTLIGFGELVMGGKRMKAGQALKKAGISKITLKTKEGLALVNGTSVMTGIAALCIENARRIIKLAETATAFYVEVLNGSPEPFCKLVQHSRGQSGQIEAGKSITELLRTNNHYMHLIDKKKWGTEPKPVEPGIDIQDPYSLRCAPQIIGAVRDGFYHAKDIVDKEVNAVTDNPLIFPKYGVVLHCGNFYGQHISFVMDYLGILMVKLALFFERHIARLLNRKYNLGLPPLLSGSDPGLNSGFMGVQLLATSLAAEARIKSTPASVQTIPTNANNQDLVSMGTHAAKKCRDIIDIVWKLAAIECMCLSQAADLRGLNTIGKSSKGLYNIIREKSDFLKEDRPLHKEIEEITDLIKTDEVLKSILKYHKVSI